MDLHRSQVFNPHQAPMATLSTVGPRERSSLAMHDGMAPQTSSLIIPTAPQPDKTRDSLPGDESNFFARAPTRAGPEAPGFKFSKAVQPHMDLMGTRKGTTACGSPQTEDIVFTEIVART